MALRWLVAALAAGGLAAGVSVPARAAQVPPTGAAAHAAGKTFTIRIVAIDRFGKRVTTEPVVLQGTNNLVSAGSQTVRLAAGHYIVGSAIETPASGSAQLSETMIAKTVTVSRSTTITLDARTGRLLTVAFSAPGAHQVFQGGALCDGIGAGAMLAGVYDDPAGTTYVGSVPKGVQMFYQSRWQTNTGTIYDLAGAAAPGSKAAPHFRDSVSKLAKVHLQLRTGASPAGPGSGFLLDHGANCEPGGDVLQVAAPWAATDYMQAGSWTTDVGIGARTLYWSGAVKAGRSYTVALGTAVYGPWPSVNGTLVPDLNGRQLAFLPAGLFSDPVAQDTVSCAASIESVLRRGTSTLRRSHAGGCSSNELTRTLPRSGWYQLQVTGTQPTRLSSKVTLNWHFYAKLGPQQSWPVALPVTLTEFRADGLSLLNAAAAGARAKVVVRVVKAAYPDSPSPVNRLKSVRLEASFDGGATWHALALRRTGASWTAAVRDPASGYVSLRSIVVNTAGDSSTQTVYKAYAIG
jgi:hypothetical protein